MEGEGWCNGTKVGGLLCVCINFVFLFSVFRIGCMLAFAFFEKTEVRTVISGDVLFHITMLKKHRYRSTFTRLPSHTES